ncbi:substrate-binding domain-containing protein [Peribacillus frigoritolerans]|nr:substrate-binding domain-containing protein [Peribacillus frigoritolerans]
MIAGIVEPPLTTIAQPIQRMGQEVVNLMIKMIKGDKEKARITLLPELVVRESTKEKDNNELDNVSVIK